MMAGRDFFVAIPYPPGHIDLRRTNEPERRIPHGQATAPPQGRQQEAQGPPRPAEATASGKGGETVAEKGEVTGEGKHPLSPADRLTQAAKLSEMATELAAGAER